MKPIILNKNQVYPTKIVCIGRNYVGHIKELNNEIPSEPVIFMKPNSSISDEIYFNENDEIHYEGEISFVVQSGKLDAVGFGLDLTKRNIQSTLKAKGLPWERAKAFDNSAVFSEFVEFSGNIEDIRMELYINDKLTQQGGCELMLYKPNDILIEIKSFLTLRDGDIVMTGTPKGVGKIMLNDSFIGKILVKKQLLVEASWVVK